jgi:hypothetical protein
LYLSGGAKANGGVPSAFTALVLAALLPLAALIK